MREYFPPERQMNLYFIDKSWYCVKIGINQNMKILLAILLFRMRCLRWDKKSVMPFVSEIVRQTLWNSLLFFVIQVEGRNI